MKKSSALALAIAGIVAAPVASAEVYVSARLGFEYIDSDASSPDDTSILEFGNLSSRLGWRGETDLGNGMTAFGSLEAAADGFSLRQLHVGLSGDFGSIKMGEKTYAAFYNHVTGPVDQPYWILFPGLIETGRTDKVLNYEGSAGAIRFGAGISADGVADADPGENADDITAVQAAISIDLGDNHTLAVGVDDDDNNEEATAGVTAHGSLGDIAYAVSFQQRDDFLGADTSDATGIQLWVGFGAFWVGYGQLDLDGSSGSPDGTPAVISAGFSHKIGPQTQFWVEVSSEDWDDIIQEDETNVVGAIRYDYN